MATANEQGKTSEQPTDAFPRWVWLAGASVLLVIGWVFILRTNGFHLTAPVVIVCLGYLAGVAAVYTLFRTGSAAATGGEDADDEASWGRPMGARGELEREKKALLKAIKEAEFDLQMDKLSKADAEAMIGSYRAQAIAVIRELDRKDSDDASVREQIEREVRARLEVAKSKKPADADKRSGKKGKKAQAEKAEKASDAAEKAEAKAEVAAEAKAEVAAEAKAEVAAEAKAAEAAEAKAAEAAEAAEPVAAQVTDGAEAAPEAAAEAAEAAAEAADANDRAGEPAAPPEGAAAVASAAKEATP